MRAETKQFTRNGINFDVKQFGLTNFTQDQIIFLSRLADNPQVSLEANTHGLDKEKIQRAVAGRGVARSGR